MYIKDIFTPGTACRVFVLKGSERSDAGHFIVPSYLDTTSEEEEDLRTRYLCVGIGQMYAGFTVASEINGNPVVTDVVTQRTVLRVVSDDTGRGQDVNFNIRDWPKILEEYKTKSKPAPSKLLSDFIRAGDKVKFAVLRTDSVSSHVNNWFILPRDKLIDLEKYMLASSKGWQDRDTAVVEDVPSLFISELVPLTTSVRIITTMPRLSLGIDLDDWPEIKAALNDVPVVKETIMKPLKHYIPDGSLVAAASSTGNNWLAAPVNAALPPGYTWRDTRGNAVYSVTLRGGSTPLDSWFTELDKVYITAQYTLTLDPELWPELKADLIKAGLWPKVSTAALDTSIAEYMEATREPVSHLIKSTPKPKSLKSLASTLSGDIYEADVPKAPAKIEGEIKMTVLNVEKIFGSAIGKDLSGMFKLSGMGIAVRAANGSFRCYDPAKTQCVDVMEMVIDTDMVYRMPAKEVAPGDLIIFNTVPYYVINTDEGNTVITVFNPAEEKMETIIPSRSILGFQFFIKVVSLFNLGGATTPQAGGLQAMLPLMLLSGKEDGSGAKKDPMEMMLMMQMMGGGDMFGAGAAAAGGGMPMLPMMMLMGQMGEKPSSGARSSAKKSGMEEMMPMLMMSQMMAGGTAGGSGGAMDMTTMLPLMMAMGSGDSGNNMSEMMMLMMMSQMMPKSVVATTPASAPASATGKKTGKAPKNPGVADIVGTSLATAISEAAATTTTEAE